MAVRERGILFSAPMVRALLAGTKTQTRRVVKWQGPKGFPHYFDRAFIDSPAGEPRLCVPYHHPDDLDMGDDGLQAHRHYPPHGQPGDRLWVRETWARDDEDGCMMYRADVGRCINADAWEQSRHEGAPRYRWRPAIHMPRWASRITLEITAVRVERLQDIGEADAIAEGIERAACEGYWKLYGREANGDADRSPRVAYRSLWESINGHGSWQQNPWVWVLEFRRIEASNGST